MIIRVKENKIYLHGTIWQGDDTQFAYHFRDIVDKYDNLDVHIHTNGGSVFAANFIMSQLSSSKAKIHYIIDGVAASMGFYMVLTGDKVSMVDNGFIMAHAPSGSTHGTAAEHRDTAVLLDGIEINFLNKVIAKTGWSKKKAEKLLVGDNWYSAEQALKAGFINHIIKAKTDVKINDVNALDQQEVFGRFAAILVDKKPKNKTQKSHKMKKELIEALGLSSVTAESSDTAVMEAVQSHITGKLAVVQGKLDTAVAQNTTLVDAAKTQTTAKIDMLLAPLVGKVSKEKIEMYRGIGNTSGIKALEGVLEGVTPRKGLKDTIVPGATSTVDKTWEEFQKDPQGQKELEKLSQSDPEAYLALGKEKFGDNWKA